MFSTSSVPTLSSHLVILYQVRMSICQIIEIWIFGFEKIPVISNVKVEVYMV